MFCTVGLGVLFPRTVFSSLTETNSVRLFKRRERYSLDRGEWRVRRELFQTSKGTTIYRTWTRISSWTRSLIFS